MREALRSAWKELSDLTALAASAARMPAITLQIGCFLHCLALDAAIFFARPAGAGRMSALLGFFVGHVFCSPITMLARKRASHSLRWKIFLYVMLVSCPADAIIADLRSLNPSHNAGNSP